LLTISSFLVLVINKYTTFHDYHFKILYPIVSKSGHDNQRFSDKFLNRVKVHFPDTIFRPYLVSWVTRNLYRDKTRINTQILGTRKRVKHEEFVCVVDMNMYVHMEDQIMFTHI
jgi:hypothetical protein